MRRGRIVLHALHAMVATLLALGLCGCRSDLSSRSMTIDWHLNQHEDGDAYSLTSRYRGDRIVEAVFEKARPATDEYFSCGTFRISFGYDRDRLTRISCTSSKDRRPRELYAAPAPIGQIELMKVGYSLELETDLELMGLVYDFEEGALRIVPVFTAFATRSSYSQKLMHRRIGTTFEYYVDFYEPIKVLQIRTDDPGYAAMLDQGPSLPGE